MESSNDHPLKVVSLFAGCGGMDLGITGGFRFNRKTYTRLPTTVVHSSDFDPVVTEIFDLNFSHNAIVQDVRNLRSDSLPKFDILLGGFPCQSFSVVAQNPPRLGVKDQKGQLFFEMTRILREKKPSAFIAENVKGLLSANSGEAFPLVLQEFENAGYCVTYKVLNASHFGVPQKRERVFIVGFRSEAALKRFAFPSPTTEHRPPSIAPHLLDPSEVTEDFYFSQRAVLGMKKTRNSRSMNKGRVQDPSGPCNTVGAHLAKASLNSTDPVLFDGARYRMFTPREVARIQSFPDSFKLSNRKRANYIALGNAVPPVLMWHVAKSLIAALRPET
ncbi:MAG: DNA (cytosine-5-)-methyltransferase [Armatimonadota bacterium]